MYVKLHETHYSYIKDIRMYCHLWRWRNCQVSLFKSLWELNCHERTCEAGVNRVYKGGVYRPPSSIFERLDDEGIVVNEALRYYPYRATFDFECYSDKANLPPDSNMWQWSARHVPLSVASNIPGISPMATPTSWWNP